MSTLLKIVSWTMETEWLNSIKKGRAISLARIVFLEYTTQEKVSLIEYPKRKKIAKGKREYERITKGKITKVVPKKTQHYVEPIVNRTFKIWEKEGFLTKSKPIFFKDKWKREQKVFWRIMNLKPIFKYCSEIKGVNFTDEEKKYLEDFILPMRKEVLAQNPTEDIIEAVLKFYSANFILRYFLMVRENRDIPSNYQEERLKSKELNSPKHPLKKEYLKIKQELSQRYGGKAISKKWDEIKVSAYGFGKEVDAFSYYYNKLERQPELVESVDRKVLKALGLYPTKI